ncbi:MULTISPECIES: hypothetical protein [unclassified Sporolactobacillus]|uniref:hypothetical protein n=1 Tax=unclassified Sporolactobacillus TaxID=2628533 RepID=UPI002368CCB7|nr:hypothetical protein [Sporolactobacillus sp. CQH2019]MDD9147531.1 hypothetical protein [Sporolactobacillus sp. CQH2019]
MQAIDIPRFDFVELSKNTNMERSEHTYFVTTDINEAAEHYLQMMRGNKPVYMTIRTIDGKTCVAKSYRLNGDCARPEMIRVNADPDLTTGAFHIFTDEFIHAVEKKLS